MHSETTEYSFKKIKIDSGVSQDPFKKIHQHVHDLILQHLTIRDALTFFEVSPSWYQVAMNSHLMQRIRLKFFERSSNDPSPSTVSMVLGSNRPYQSLTAQFRFPVNIVAKLELLQNFSENLIDLEIDCSCSEDIEAESFPQALLFPKLKSLKLNNKPAINFKLLSATRSLEKLSININMDKSVVKVLKRICKGLKELELKGDIQELSESLKDVKFTLDSLTITNHVMTSNSVPKFEKFLKGCDVSCITMSHCNNSDVAMLLNEMKNLKSLHIKKWQNCTFAPQPTSNKTITEFKFGIIYGSSSSEILPKEIIENLKKLEVLTLFNLSKQDLLWIVKNLKIKKLNFYRWTEKTELNALQDVKLNYEMLKRKISSANKKIELINVDKF